MVIIRRIVGVLVNAVGLGMSLGEPIGVAIEPVFVGLRLVRTRPVGKLRWEAVRDDDSTVRLADRMSDDPRCQEGDVAAMAVACVNRVLDSGDGRFYCYGVVDAVAIRPGRDVGGPTVGGRPSLPDLTGLRDAVEQWMGSHYGTSLTDVTAGQQPRAAGSGPLPFSDLPEIPDGAAS